MMNKDKIEKIKDLWIEIFGDSRRYVDMIIDNYFDSSLSITKWDNNKLIASSLVIPYKFYSENSTDTDNLYSGLYLCGLATIPERRGEGIMREIIAGIEAIAIRKNYAFTFLIPADEHLRNYYKKLDYKDSIKLCRIKLNNFNKNYSINDDRIITDKSSDINKNIFIYTNDATELTLKNISKYLADRSLNILEERKLSHIGYAKYNSDAKGLKSGVEILKMIHSETQWFDVIGDYLEEGSAVISDMDFTKNVGDCHYVSDAALCILTKDRKIIPLAGETHSVIQLIFSKISSYKNIEDEFTIVVYDGQLAQNIISELMHLKNENAISFSVECEKYGMVKFLKEGYENSSIEFGLVFD